jgi:hypothetical protein
MKKVLFILLLGSLIIPAFQNKLKFFSENRLNGAIVETLDSTLSLSNWWDGSYQLQKEKYLNDHFGFRSFFVRLNNQIAYSLFNSYNANGVISGKEDYLYEENYLKAVSGKDYIGDDSVAIRFQKLKFLSDTLEKLGKQLVLIFAPGKGTFYNEFVPDEYKTTVNKTNFNAFLQKSKELGLKYIDFNTHFLNIKQKSAYPLYPKNGIHWSKYGMYIAADSIIKFTQKMRSIDMNNIGYSSISFDTKEDVHHSDDDIFRGLNILVSNSEKGLAYPIIQFEQDATKAKPKAIVISDSFFWGLFNYGVLQSSFNESHFWYYNNEIYPESYTKPLNTSMIDYKDELLKHDVIFVLATEASLPKFGWGFIDKAYGIFHDNSKIGNVSLSEEMKTKIKSMIDYIKTDTKWYSSIQKYANEKSISIDSALFINAKWVVENPQ